MWAIPPGRTDSGGTENRDLVVVALRPVRPQGLPGEPAQLALPFSRRLTRSSKVWVLFPEQARWCLLLLVPPGVERVNVTPSKGGDDGAERTVVGTLGDEILAALARFAAW